MAQPQPSEVQVPAQPENQQIPRSPYPAPPPFWKHFTVQNATRLKEAESQPDFSPSSLPYELAVLRPPLPPTSPEQTYTTFGLSHLVNPKPTLPEDKDVLLFDPDELLRPITSSAQTGEEDNGADTSARPHARLLSRLTKSLLLNFLELSTIMAENPRDLYEDKVHDIGMLVQNVAAVINLLRPHQARESVKIMLENRLLAGKEEMEKCDEMKGRVLEFLKTVEANGTDGDEKLKMGNVLKNDEDSDEDDEMDTAEDEVAKKSVNGNGLGGSIATATAMTAQQQKEGDVERARRLWAMLDDLDGD